MYWVMYIRINQFSQYFELVLRKWYHDNVELIIVVIIINIWTIFELSWLSHRSSVYARTYVNVQCGCGCLSYLHGTLNSRVHRVCMACYVGTVCTIWTFTNFTFDLKVSPNLPYPTLLLPSCSTVLCSPTSRNCYQKWDMVSTVHAHIRDVTTCMRMVEGCWRLVTHNCSL